MWEGAVSAVSSWPPHSKLLLFISDKEATRPLVNLSSSVTLQPFQILDREYHHGQWGESGRGCEDEV